MNFAIICFKNGKWLRTISQTIQYPGTIWNFTINISTNVFQQQNKSLTYANLQNIRTIFHLISLIRTDVFQGRKISRINTSSKSGQRLQVKLTLRTNYRLIPTCKIRPRLHFSFIILPRSMLKQSSLIWNANQAAAMMTFLPNYLNILGISCLCR